MVRIVPSCTLLAALCLTSFAAVCAAQDHFPSNEDLRHVRAISEPHLSPDGRSVLVEITDPTADGGRGHLWRVDLRSNTARRLTYAVSGPQQGEFGAPSPEPWHGFDDRQRIVNFVDKAFAP